MQWLPSFLVALCSLTAGGIATAASGGVGFYPSDQQLLTAEGHVVAAVTIEDARPPIGTRGKPPLVALRIEALIRGRIAQQRVEAAWLPPDYVGSIEGDNTPPPSWLAEPLPAPTPGTRLILLLSREGSEFRIANRCRYPDTLRRAGRSERRSTTTFPGSGSRPRRPRLNAEDWRLEEGHGARERPRA